MKNKLLRVAVAAGLSSLAFGFPACKRNAIVILPAENEDPEMKKKWTAIAAALKGHEELYYVKEFDMGVEIAGDNPTGNLFEILRERDFRPSERGFMQKKFTGHAFQIGVGLKAKSDVRYIGDPHLDAGYAGDADATPQKTPTPGPLWPHLHLIKEIKESAKLVEKVDEILSKPAPAPSTPEP